MTGLPAGYALPRPAGAVLHALRQTVESVSDTFKSQLDLGSTVRLAAPPCQHPRRRLPQMPPRSSTHPSCVRSVSDPGIAAVAQALGIMAAGGVLPGQRCRPTHSSTLGRKPDLATARLRT
jgi:hypothetical protein